MTTTNTTPQTTTPASTGSSSSSNVAASIASFSANENSFLTLLTTQLQHQDPLAPMDSTQFTQQLVEFSGVEQQIQTNSNLSTLISLQQSSQASTALSYLGNEVEVSGSSLPLVKGQGQFSYTLSAPAKTVTVTITDHNGNEVRTLTGQPVDATKHTITWDGKDDFGNTQTDGVYNFSVTALDASGNAISGTDTFFGPVTGVSGLNSSSSSSSSSSSAAPKLLVDGQQVSLSNVLSVAATPQSSSTSSTSDIVTSAANSIATAVKNAISSLLPSV